VVERQLVRRAREYDRDALAEIHTRYSRKIYDHIYHWTGDRSLAEDLTAEVFMKFLETVEIINSQTSLQAVLYRIAGRLVIEHRGRQPLYSEPPSELRQVIRRLPADQQQVLVLKLVEEMPNHEIAQIIDRTEEAVKTLQHHALVALRWLMRN